MRRIKFQSETRDVTIIPVEVGGDENGFFILGDCADVDAKVPKGKDGVRVRNPKLQPNPVRIVTVEELDGFGEFARDILGQYVRQGRITRVELAA